MYLNIGWIKHYTIVATIIIVATCISTCYTSVKETRKKDESPIKRSPSTGPTRSSKNVEGNLLTKTDPNLSSRKLERNSSIKQDSSTSSRNFERTVSIKKDPSPLSRNFERTLSIKQDPSPLSKNFERTLSIKQDSSQPSGNSFPVSVIVNQAGLTSKLQEKQQQIQPNSVKQGSLRVEEASHKSDSSHKDNKVVAAPIKTISRIDTMRGYDLWTSLPEVARDFYKQIIENDDISNEIIAMRPTSLCKTTKSLDKKTDIPPNIDKHCREAWTILETKELYPRNTGVILPTDNKLQLGRYCSDAHRVDTSQDQRRPTIWEEYNFQQVVICKERPEKTIAIMHGLQEGCYIYFKKVDHPNLNLRSLLLTPIRHGCKEEPQSESSSKVHASSVEDIGKQDSPLVQAVKRNILRVRVGVLEYANDEEIREFLGIVAGDATNVMKALSVVKINIVNRAREGDESTLTKRRLAEEIDDPNLIAGLRQFDEFRNIQPSTSVTNKSVREKALTEGTRALTEKTRAIAEGAKALAESYSTSIDLGVQLHQGLLKKIRKPKNQ